LRLLLHSYMILIGEAGYYITVSYARSDIAGDPAVRQAARLMEGLEAGPGAGAGQ
jgi:hypothetical protein